MTHRFMTTIIKGKTPHNDKVLITHHLELPSTKKAAGMTSRTNMADQTVVTISMDAWTRDGKVIQITLTRTRKCGSQSF